MAKVPIIRIGDVLIATVQEDLLDRDALALQENLSHAIEESGARGVLLDLSIIELVDSFLGRLLNDVALSARLLGAETVVAGIQPAVAVTLVELGLDLRGVPTALNTEKGMALLRRLIATEQTGPLRDGRHHRSGGTPRASFDGQLEDRERHTRG